MYFITINKNKTKPRNFRSFFVILCMFVTLREGTTIRHHSRSTVSREEETFLLIIRGEPFSGGLHVSAATGQLGLMWQRSLESWYVVSFTLCREQQSLPERTRGWRMAVGQATNSIVFCMESC